MLENLLNGKENFKKLLIEDNESESGLSLLKSFTLHLAKRCDIVHLILYSIDKYVFLNGLPESILQKLIIYDAVDNLLGWNEDVDSKFTLDSNVLDVISEEKGKKIAVVIDDLNLFITRYSCFKSCRLIHRLCMINDFTPIVTLIHTDLCNESDLRLLNQTANTVLKVSSSMDPSYLYLCSISHQKTSGKLIHFEEHISFNSDYSLLQCKLFEKSKSKSAGDVTGDSALSNLTFNLSLNEHEKQAREQLQLPYMHHQNIQYNSGGGTIFYEADDADDIDEDDPDDDLCI